MSEAEEDRRLYSVVVNEEEQYSIWLAGRQLPVGWRHEGFGGSRAECLSHVEEIWTDMRPLGLRKRMEQDPA